MATAVPATDPDLQEPSWLAMAMKVAIDTELGSCKVKRAQTKRGMQLPRLELDQSSSSSSAVPRMFSRVKPNSSNSCEAGADSP